MDGWKKRLMDGWINGWMDGWMDGWLVDWLVGWMVGLMNMEVDGQVYKGQV